MKKRVLSFFLAVALVFSLVVIPTSAKGNVEVRLNTVGYSTADAMTEYVTETEELEKASIGDFVAAKIIVANNTDNEIWFSGYHITLNYDATAFETVTYPWELSVNGSVIMSGTAGPFAKASKGAGGISWQPEVNTKNAGVADMAATSREYVNIPAGGTATIGYLLLKVKAEIETGEYAITFAEGEQENYVNSASGKDESVDAKISDAIFVPASLTINGVAPELDYVEVTDATGNVLAHSKSETGKYADQKRADEVTLDSKTSYTYYVKAYSKKGTDITDQVQWSISHDRPETVGAQLDVTEQESKIVKVTIPEKGGSAKGVTLSEITAKMPEAAAGKTAKILYRRADSIPTSADISLREGSSASLQVPGTGADAVTAQFGAVIYDQFGENITSTALGSSCHWNVESANDGSTSTTGISMNSTGLLTVKSNALNTVQNGNTSYTVYIQANQASGGKRVGTYPITVSLSDRVPASIVISGTVSTLAVPKTGESNATATYTATVKDQYGDVIADPGTIEWKLRNESTGDTFSQKGVTIDQNGVVTITKEAAGNPFLEGTRKLVYIEATCGDATERISFTLTREAATVTTLKITGPDTLEVPTKSEYPNGQITPYPVTIYDQYGVEMNSDDYSFGRELETTGVSDVIFQPDGVKVTCYAAGNQFDQNNALTFTIKASCLGKEATKTITLKRQPSVATAITYNDTETTVVPTDDAQVPTKAAPAVEDQYGLLMNNATVEPDGALPTGIVLKNGELYITKAAVAHFDGERKVQVSVNLKCAPAKNTAKLKLKLAAAQINKDSAEITGPASIAKPTGEQTNTAEYSIGAIVDQYGLPITFEPSKLTMTLEDKEDEFGFSVKDGPVTLSGPVDGKWTITVTSGAVVNTKYYLKAKYSDMQCAPVMKITITDKAVSETPLPVVQGDITYGETVSPSVSNKPAGAGAITYTYAGRDGTTYNSSDAPTNAGKYTVTATCEDANYIYTGSVDFQILPKEIKVDWIELDGTRYTYNGQQQTAKYTVKDKDINKLLEEGTDYTVEGDKQTNAGVHLLKIIGTGNYTSNFTAAAGAPSVNWNIRGLPVRINTAAFQSRAYAKDNYSAVLDTLTLVTEDGSATPDTMAAENGFTVSDIRVTNNNAGRQPVSFKVTLTNTNYKWAVAETGNTFDVDERAGFKVEITKANHAAETVLTGGKYGNQLSVDLSQYLPENWSAAVAITENTNAVLTEIHGSAMYIMEQDGKLWLQLTNDSNKVGKDATVTLTVNSTNYNSFTITVTVTVRGKETQTITASDLNVTYGDAGVKLNASALDNAKLTYQVTGGTDVVTVDANGNVTLLKSGTAKIRITAAETEDYGVGTKLVTVTVAKRSLTVKANDLTAYVGGQLPALDYTVTGLVSGETLTTVPELELKDVPAGVDPMKTAGTYTIGFKTAPVADPDKYDLTVETGTLTVSSRPNVNPVPAGNSVKLEEAAGGKLTSSVSRATKGTTVTITVKPDAGYQLEELEVLDKNGEALPLKELANGKFSFQMPDSKVTVQASFVQESTYAGYPDVLPQDWFYSSVRYVTERGLMNGTPNGFEPNMDSSRATIWTILARFSGVDTTVVSGEWYAVARQWAMENGVSDGTNPNGVITREQLATMLYRFAKNKGLVQEPVTADLSVFVDAGQISDYALDAMRWAVSVGLLNGMDGSRLAPQGSAARAQVAAMLMRFDQLAK